jgi:hypothetical protein
MFTNLKFLFLSDVSKVKAIEEMGISAESKTIPTLKKIIKKGNADSFQPALNLIINYAKEDSLKSRLLLYDISKNGNQLVEQAFKKICKNYNILKSIDEKFSTISILCFNNQFNAEECFDEIRRQCKKQSIPMPVELHLTKAKGDSWWWVAQFYPQSIRELWHDIDEAAKSTFSGNRFPGNPSWHGGVDMFKKYHTNLLMKWIVLKNRWTNY